MKINLSKFEKLLKKATISYSIETLRLKFNEHIETEMRSGNGNSISILKLENDVLDVRDEEFIFNFSDVAQNVVPFIQLFDDEEVDIELVEGSSGLGYMVLVQGNQRSRISFCFPNIPKRLGTKDVKQDVDWFFNIDVDESFMSKFDKIKKVGSRFGNVYLDVLENEVFLETADKNNVYSNGLKFKLADIEKENLTLCFSYKDMVNLFNILEIEKNFNVKFTYDVHNELGMMYVFSQDGSEKYCLLSLQI